LHLKQVSAGKVGEEQRRMRIEHHVAKRIEITIASKVQDRERVLVDADEAGFAAAMGDVEARSATRGGNKQRVGCLLLCNFYAVLTALSPRCGKHWWMGHFWRRFSLMFGNDKFYAIQQCSNCHDDAEAGTNPCRLSPDYLNPPANLFYLVL
jgi:hypothetical protein